MNDRIDAVLCGLFMAVVVATAAFGIAAILRARKNPVATAREVRRDPIRVSHA